MQVERSKLTNERVLSESRHCRLFGTSTLLDVLLRLMQCIQLIVVECYNEDFFVLHNTMHQPAESILNVLVVTAAAAAVGVLETASTSAAAHSPRTC